MPQIRVPAAYYRGGTSRAVVFREEDLAGYSDAERDAIILAAIGPFAIDEGFVEARDSITPVTVLSVNTNQRYIAHVPTSGGKAEPEGDYELDGVAGRHAKIALEFLEPGGSQGRGLLPTGRPREVFELADGRRIEVSVVDAANPYVFARAADLGAIGTELPTVVDADPTLHGALQELRALAAVRMGLAADVEDA